MAAVPPPAGFPGMPGVPGAPPMPGAFGAPFVYAGSQDRPTRAPILTDDPSQFMMWQESFSLAIDRQGNLQWTLIINDVTRAQRVAQLGLDAIRQYTDQEMMWQWLHEACKYSDKARTIIAHAMMNKGVPQFATEAWKAIVRRFNPATPKNQSLRQAELKKKIASFNGEWREWIQDVLHHHMLLIESGKQLPEVQLIDQLLSAIGEYTKSNSSAKSRAWEAFIAELGRINAAGAPPTLQQMAVRAELLEDGQTFTGTYVSEPDPDSTKHNLAHAFASIIAREATGGDRGLAALNPNHLSRMRDGLDPTSSGLDMGDPIAAKHYAALRSPPAWMLQTASQILGLKQPTHRLEPGSSIESPASNAILAECQRLTQPAPQLTLEEQASSINETLNPTGSSNYLLNASNSTPAAAGPSLKPALRGEKASLEVFTPLPASTETLFCMHCGARHKKTTEIDSLSFACARCGKDTHGENQCRIDAARTRQDEENRNHLDESGDEQDSRDSPHPDRFPGVKKTVNFKPRGGGRGSGGGPRNTYNRRDDRGRFTREDSQSPRRNSGDYGGGYRREIECYICGLNHRVFSCPLIPHIAP
eukprot:2478553-Rhodomonas_salina.1